MRLVLRKIRNGIVLMRFRMSRGYIFLQSFTFAFLAAGVLQPYVPWLNIWQLGILGMATFYTAGWLEMKFGFIQEENRRATELNPVIQEMRGNLRKKNEKS